MHAREAVRGMMVAIATAALFSAVVWAQAPANRGSAARARYPRSTGSAARRAEVPARGPAGRVARPDSNSYASPGNRQASGGFPGTRRRVAIGQHPNGPRPNQLVISDNRVTPAFFPSPMSEADVDPMAVRASLAEQLAKTVEGEHPLMPAIRWAKTERDHLDTVQDYSCTLVKRERIEGELGEHEYMFVKVRHQPFSVYMYFLGPAAIKGREVIFVEGQNEDCLVAHPEGAKGRIFRQVKLKPDSRLAMSGNRYPITELGLMRLTRRLIEVGEHDSQFGECDVRILPGAKVDKRDCTCIEVSHPVPRRDFLFHMARIFVDTEYNLPVRYEAYDWPQEEGTSPVLNEEYTYIDLKFNNGYADIDFDPTNPAYQFQRK